MTVTAHAMIGAVIGQAADAPGPAFLISFALHFLLDIIPHGDHGISDNFRIFKRKRRRAVAYVLVDGMVALFLVLILVNFKDIESVRSYSWGIAGAVLPDFLVGIYEVTKWRHLRRFTRLHFLFHDFLLKRWGDVRLRYALVIQLLLIIYLQSKL